MAVIDEIGTVMRKNEKKCNSYLIRQNPCFENDLFLSTCNIILLLLI